MTKNERHLLIEMLNIKKELAHLNNDIITASFIDIEIKAVKRGYKEFYELDDLELPEEKDEDWTTFIMDVLTMYSVMINSIERSQKAPYSHSLEDVRFPGFDGNNEIDEKKFVEFFIIDNNRFSEIDALNKGDYNSHVEMKPTYTRMLREYEIMGRPAVLDDNQIKRLLAL